MATALVRNLDEEAYERLKTRAASNNCSLEAELREILTIASKQVEMAAAWEAAQTTTGAPAEQWRRVPCGGTPSVMNQSSNHRDGSEPTTLPSSAHRHP